LVSKDHLAERVIAGSINTRKPGMGYSVSVRPEWWSLFVARGYGLLFHIKIK
jgi:hypothetical protein